MSRKFPAFWDQLEKKPLLCGEGLQKVFFSFFSEISAETLSAWGLIYISSASVKGTLEKVSHEGKKPERRKLPCKTI